MFRNYLIVALRNIWRNRSFSIINICGLGLSLAVCLVVISILVQNFSYDTFHAKRERIYRITQMHREFDMQIPFATIPMPVGEQLTEQAAGIEAVSTMVRFIGDLTYQDKSDRVNGLYVDDSFFKVFSFEALSPQARLSEPFTLMITRKAAEKYFGKEDPTGKVVTVAGVGEFTVSGLMENPPVTSHIQFEVLLSQETLRALSRPVVTDWMEFGRSASVYTYVLMEEGASVASLEPVLDNLVKAHYASTNLDVAFHIQSFDSIAPSREWMNNEMASIPNMNSTFLLMGLSLIIILSAGFNYANLTVARSLTRAREVGLRKVAGAYRGQVITQFVFEAILISLFAFVAALAVGEFLQSGLRNLLGPGQNLSFASDYRVYLAFLFFTVLVGLLAGLLPAGVLAGFKPVEVLKGSVGLRLLKGIGLRKALIVFQFVISMLFLLSANVMTRQFLFALNGPLGYDHERVASVDLGGELPDRFLQNVLKEKNVMAASASSFLPGTNHGAMDEMKNPDTQQKSMVFYFSADQNFLPLLNLKLVAGKNFPEQADRNREQFILINEAFVSQLGYQNPADALGKLVEVGGNTLHIIGVLKDFHYRPLDAPEGIGPAAIRFKPDEFFTVNVKVTDGKDTGAIESVERAWKALDNGHPFVYDFFDNQLRNALNRYRIMSGLMKFVSLLAVVIACLGLLGMAMYSVNTRLKEVAIRKTMGANAWQIMRRLSKGFVMNLAVASMVALPLGYLVNKAWLDQVPYRITLTPWLLLGAPMFIFSIGLFTIVSQTWMAASRNPVEFLRGE